MRGEPEPEITPVEEPQPEPQPEPTPEPTPTPTPEAPKRKKKVAIVPDLEPAPAPTPTPAPVLAPTPAPHQPPQADPDDEYVRGLTDEQREELIEAEHAEKLFPDRYKGRRKSLIAWYRNFDTQVTDLMRQDPGRKLDDTDEEFSKLTSTKPSLLPVHSKKVQRAIGEEQAVSRVQKQYEPELAEIRRRQEEIDYRPTADRLVNQFQAGVEELVSADDKSVAGSALRVINAKPTQANGKWKIGDAEFATQAEAQAAQTQIAEGYKLEKTIFEEERTRAATMTREALMFSKGLRSYDPNNRTHRELLDFINTQGREFATKGGDLRVRDGRMFLPREQYVPLARSNPAEANKYWTWGDRDLVELLAFDAKARMENRISQAETIAKQMGFQRVRAGVSATPPKPAGTPTPKKEPKPINPPKAAPKAARGINPPAPAAEPTTGSWINPAEVLGLRRKSSTSA
jgi:hypothetical protein